ncbi:hypothetical protein ACHAWC_008620 [Mediolabrus comicus]
MPLKDYHLAPSSNNNLEIEDTDDYEELLRVGNDNYFYRIKTMLCGGKTNNSTELCRFAWRPRLLTVLLMLAFVLSIASSLYCEFLSVRLGFVPQGYTNNEVGVSFWSFQGQDGKCKSFQEAYKLGGFSIGDTSYSNWITNDDLAWTISRVMAMVGVAFGVVALTCILINLCSSEPHLVDVLAYTTVIAMVSEAAKVGLFFSTNLCRSQNFWYNDEKEEYVGSTSCVMSHGAFVCIASIAIYFISALLLIGYHARPKSDEYDYDVKSLEEMTEMGKTYETQSTSGFNQSSSNMGSHISRGGSHMSSQVGTSSHMNSHQSRSRNSTDVVPSYYDEVVEEEEEDTMRPLPQFQRSRIPNARRQMDDMSAITMDTTF